MAQSLPSIVSGEGGLARYLEEIRRFPMLQPQEEYMLAKRYAEHQDTTAAHKLVTSHLRLVAKIAMGYRGYGLPIGEVISEGNVGLMQAVKKFEPERGFRLATYAMWWIKASIQEYILRSWSLVKMGTTANQKRLFFNLRKVKGKIQALDDGDLKPDQIAEIATRLNVSEAEVRIAQLGRGLGVAMLAPAVGEHVLFLRREDREFLDLGEIAVESGLAAGRGERDNPFSRSHYCRLSPFAGQPV